MRSVTITHSLNTDRGQQPFGPCLSRLLDALRIYIRHMLNIADIAILSKVGISSLHNTGIGKRMIIASGTRLITAVLEYAKVKFVHWPMSIFKSLLVVAGNGCASESVFQE